MIPQLVPSLLAAMRVQDDSLLPPTTTVVEDGGWARYGMLVIVVVTLAALAPALWSSFVVSVPRTAWSLPPAWAAAMAVAGEPVPVMAVLALTVVFLVGGHGVFRAAHGFWHGLVVAPAMARMGGRVDHCRHHPRTCGHLVPLEASPRRPHGVAG